MHKYDPPRCTFLGSFGSLGSKDVLGPCGFRVKLLTEAEWEFAARGRLAIVFLPILRKLVHLHKRSGPPDGEVTECGALFPGAFDSRRKRRIRTRCANRLECGASMARLLLKASVVYVPCIARKGERNDTKM